MEITQTGAAVKAIERDNLSAQGPVLAAAVDSSHNLYVMGYYDGGGTLRWDWRIKKFDASGTEDTNWDKTFDSNSGQADTGQSLLVVTLP